MRIGEKKKKSLSSSCQGEGVLSSSQEDQTLCSLWVSIYWIRSTILQKAIFFIQSTSSDINLLQNHPHRTPRIMFYQISGQPMAQSSWHKINYHIIEVCMFTILELLGHRSLKTGWLRVKSNSQACPVGLPPLCLCYIQWCYIRGASLCILSALVMFSRSWPGMRSLNMWPLSYLF